jgi:hypothetical protein
VSDPIGDDALFERLAEGTDPLGMPPDRAPASLKEQIVNSLDSREPDDNVFANLAAAEIGEAAPASLKSRVYSALVARQAGSGPLLGLREVKAGLRGLCVFEELVRIAPVGEKLQAFNWCRVCHARALAERMDSAPIYWPHCPYVLFQGR